PTDQQVVVGNHADKSIEHESTISWAFLLPWHVMPSVSNAKIREFEHGRMHQMFKYTLDRRFSQVRTRSLPHSDERPQYSPRRGWPFGHTFVDVPAPRGGVETPGGEGKLNAN